MATYWLADNGNDANDGTSYAQAKATLSAAVALLSQGDTLNCVGSFDLLGTNVTIDGTSLRGTSWNDPACIIQGTDSSGAPAMCNLTNSGFSREWLRSANEAAYLIIRGFNMDTTGITNESIFFEAAGFHSPFRIEYCSISGSPSATGTNMAKLVYDVMSFNASQVVNPAHGYVRYCYLENAAIETRNQILEVDHVVFRLTENSNTAHFLFQGSTTSDRGPLPLLSNCTFDIDCLDALPRLDGTIQDSNNNVSIETAYRMHSHVFALTTTNTPDKTTGFMYNGVVKNSQATTSTAFSGTVGHNWFIFSTEVATYLTDITTATIYESYYNPDYPTTTENDTGIHATDVRLDGSVIADIINATSAWTWTDVNGSGYDIDLPKDYRIVNTTAQTAAFDGGVVGAITELTNTPPVIDSDWNSSLDPITLYQGDTTSVTAGSGLSTVCSDPDLDTLTYSVLDDVSHGTLTLNTTDGSFEYTANFTYSGTDSFTFKACDGTTCTTYITDTSQNPKVYFNVLEIPVVTSGPGDPVEAEFLDVAPFFRPTLEVTTEFRIKTRKNRRKHHDLANYTEKVLWDESTHRVINLGTNTTSQITTGGIETAEYVIVETDNDIRVSINNNTSYWPVSEVVALALSNVTSLYLKNESTTNTAQVILALAD